MRGHVGITTEHYVEVSVSFTREEFEALTSLVSQGAENLTIMGYERQQIHLHLLRTLDAARRQIAMYDLNQVNHLHVFGETRRLGDSP